MHDLKDELESQVIQETALSFSKLVIDRVWDKDIPYFDSLHEIMYEKGYEPEHVAKLVSPELKSFLSEEAAHLKLIKKEARLDF